MLLLALSCRHATPPQTVATEQQEVLDTAVAPCDTNAFVGSPPSGLGPQECNTDSDCTTHSLAELASMMPVDARPAPRAHRRTRFDGGLEVAASGARNDAGECSRTGDGPRESVHPTPPTPGVRGRHRRAGVPSSARRIRGVHGRIDGVVREQCIAELPTPVCANSVGGWAARDASGHRARDSQQNRRCSHPCDLTACHVETPRPMAPNTRRLTPSASRRAARGAAGAGPMASHRLLAAVWPAPGIGCRGVRVAAADRVARRAARAMFLRSSERRRSQVHSARHRARQ